MTPVHQRSAREFYIGFRSTGGGRFVGMLRALRWKLWGRV